jgi:O-antigen/teichoic acid export membrane protein
MNRTFLMLRSVAFAFVTKMSGGATVFLALPIISHGVSANDYAGFLTTMNIAAAVGLLFLPFSIVYIRELAHAFATADPDLAASATRNTFGSHATLTIAATGCLAIGVVAAWNTFAITNSILIGIILNLIQMAASWGQLFRIADRSDYVTSIAQTASNFLMVICLVILSQNEQLSALSVSVAYFGIPAIAELFVFFQLVISRRLALRIDRNAIAAFRARVPACIPLYLSPFADYVKVYASAMLVLISADAYNYILFSTSILLIARLVNPITLVTRPMMPAFIDALHREDTDWLRGLKYALFAAAAAGGAIAALLPFCGGKEILSFVFPKEVHDVSIFYVFFCSYFAFAYGLVALLAPLYIGAHRGTFYGISNLGFTVVGAGIGALLSSTLGAPAMMGALAIMTTTCGLFLLSSINWAKDSRALKNAQDGRGVA